jgi:hypothetical protein
MVNDCSGGGDVHPFGIEADHHLRVPGTLLSGWDGLHKPPHTTGMQENVEIRRVLLDSRGAGAMESAESGLCQPLNHARGVCVLECIPVVGCIPVSVPMLVFGSSTARMYWWMRWFVRERICSAVAVIGKQACVVRMPRVCLSVGANGDTGKK